MSRVFGLTLLLSRAALINMKTFKGQENPLRVIKLTENGFTNVSGIVSVCDWVAENY